MALSIRIGVSAMDFESVHGWLSATYWSPGISRETVERAASGSSMVIGAFEDDRQVGYCRVVSDRATFAWVCDVFVAETHRGQGVARMMVGKALADPEHQGLRRWLLATKDAHGVYAELGFLSLTNPERWMIYRPT